MSKRVIRSEADDTTRERILKAAMLRFSAHSYEETGLRDIAADAKVDMAYVQRCFGSKEKLFYEAVKATFQPERVFVGETRDLPSILAKDVLTDRGKDEIRSLDIAIRSLSSPDASRVLRELMMEDFVGPLMRKHDGVSEKRAAVIAALLGGVGVLRDVIGAAALQEEEGGELERIITNVIASLLDGEPDNDCTKSTSPSMRPSG